MISRTSPEKEYEKGRAIRDDAEQYTGDPEIIALREQAKLLIETRALKNLDAQER